MNKPNRLIHEKSPYLLQHAHNPVDWYPWGPEAFARSKAEDKPLLLSIGYSTCHWCHVMERESFEDPKIAALMNQHLVCVKLDREERPDVDKIYMTAVSAMTGAGGWPLNVFLTPELKPIFGGTYFPPEPRYGRMSWPQLVERIGTVWRDPDQRKRILVQGDQIVQGLASYLSLPKEADAGDADIFDVAFHTFKEAYQSDYGGFGYAPKFPMPVNQNFLMRYAVHAKKNPELKTQSSDALRMAAHTLTAMAGGGVYDQIGGGFHRYSTDPRWHVPHFEKMLYDNGQLVGNYVDAFRLLGHPEFPAVVRDTLDWVRREMTHPGGGFFSALDADSFAAAGAAHKTEGAYYVWDSQEIAALLGEPAAKIFNGYYGVEPDGNALEDPQGEFTRKNILYRLKTAAELAQTYQKSEADIGKILEAARQTLLQARAKRPAPHLDDKILAAWNGLMISGAAKAHQAFGRPEDLSSAQNAARFIQKNLYDASARQVFRRWRDGERAVNGMADDYAYLMAGLIDLYEADFDSGWLFWARDLAETLLAKFHDKINGGFFMTEEAAGAGLAIRIREEQDNVEPSAASAAIGALAKLAEIFDRTDFLEAAGKTVASLKGMMLQEPRSFPQMIAEAISLEAGYQRAVIVGAPSSPETREMLEIVRVNYLPGCVTMLLDGSPSAQALTKANEFLKSLKMIEGKTTAYICQGRTCKSPTTSVEDFKKQILQ